LLGQQIGNSYQYVHLIGHSAGAGLIQAAADAIRQASPTTVIQTTFLDPFVGFDYSGLSSYGNNANWSDDYFTPVDAETSPFGDTTGLPLSKAYDVDVSWVGPHQVAWYFGPTGGQVAVSSHGYPIDFYIGSITGGNLSCSAGYGFSLSMEMEGASWVNNPANEPIGISPVPPCSPPDAILNPNSGSGALQSIIAGGVIDINGFAYWVDNGVVNGAGAILNSIWSVIPHVKTGGTNIPAWLAVGVNVTNAVNFVQFDAAFADTNSAQGLLTVYWNTNQIGMVDERVTTTNLQTYRFELPSTVSSGAYTLSFRLDSFADSSSIVVTNVATGFVGVTQPSMLGISITNGVPMLKLTGANNYTYLIQSSTNLLDWIPMAFLVNTNGASQFMDSPVTNSGARFYRAMPWSANSSGVTNIVFSDNFSGNSINSTKWTTSGNTVLQTNQTMEVLTTATDAGGNLTSVAFPVNSTGKITITRQTFLHYGNSYFIGHFGINIGSLGQFSVQYADMTYGDGVTFQPCYGFYLTRNNARPDYIGDNADIGPAFTPVWDTWFAEKVTYDPASGVMEYFINGVSKSTYNVGALPPTNSPTMSLTFSAWGWYTGHEQLFQNLVVSQQTP
jgi:hypothetical protein